MAISILEITEQIEKNQVQGSIGVGESIQYVYKNGQTIPEVKSFVSALKQDEVKSHGLQSQRIFYSVELPKKPTYKDIIIYNGENYLVEKTIRDDTFSNLYDIIATLNKVPKGQKYGY